VCGRPWSADIRAPFISELFTSQPPGFNKATIPDPFHNNQVVNFTSTNQGNSALVPGKCHHDLRAALF